jgi:hypothetical protein
LLDRIVTSRPAAVSRPGELQGILDTRERKRSLHRDSGGFQIAPPTWSPASTQNSPVQSRIEKADDVRVVAKPSFDMGAASFDSVSRSQPWR